jgi:superfamily I DNA/RNA helicase
MSVQCLRAIGGAGTGKTAMMKGIAEKALERPETGGNPFSLGFSSFTRAARTEAAMRCGAAWGIPPEELMREGWFRTAHSVCYRQLGVSRGEIIGGSKEDTKWVSEAIGSDVAFSLDEDEGGIGVYTGDAVAAAALNYWSLARNVCRPLREIVEADQDPEAPSADEVIKRIEMFEQAKRLDARCDFTDLLARFVGLKFDPELGPIEVAPEGRVPDEVVGWIFDEAQDASRLLDLACRRLVTGDSCKWAWLVGDPFQCQPTGTPVLTTKGYKPIEALDPATDCLIAFNRKEGKFYGHNKQIPFQSASREIDSGELVEITLADGSVQVSTDNHKWLCRTLRGDWYATYLMRKGDRWRVGTVQMFQKWSEKASAKSKEKNGEFRFGMRMNQEAADEGWILRVFKTDREARMHEQIVSFRFGVPQVTFRPPCGCKNNLDQQFIDSVFDGVGELHGKAAACLEWHGLSPLFPYRKKADRKKNGLHASRFTEACNLLPHITLLPRVRESAFDGLRKGRRTGVYRTEEAEQLRRMKSRVEWIPVVSVKRMPAGERVVVHSLNVDKHHTYITKDRYITGNCIYGWSGASAANFMAWETVKQHIMPKSWRCAPPIMELAERCLQRLPDYWDRGIAPADHDGEVVESDNFEDDLNDLRPDEDTLVIARTNRNVAKIKAILDDIGVPCRYVKAKEGSLNRDRGMAGLWGLQHGEAISGEAWGHIVEMLPSKTVDGREWLVRGSKSQWKKGLSERYDRIYPEDLPELGATEHLREAIANGSWSGLPDGGTKWVRAAKEWGVEAVSDPKIRIGTVHSSKGMEASKVVLLTTQGYRTRMAEESDEAKFAEERRIEYVACTRAKHKLIVAHDPRAKYRMELPL